MSRVETIGNAMLYLGDCLETIRTLPDCSVDSIVTDPPYGLGKEPDALAMLADWLATGHHDVKGSGFMGKAWDAFVPQPALWRECLRVLKPGGHLLAFAGTRTHDLMTLGLRIAGFEIRDTIMWVYGSGFPKSLDVSKAIDKLDAAEEQLNRRHKFCDWMRSTGITQPQLRDIFHSMQTFSTKDSCNTQASSYLYHAKQGPAVMPRYVMEVVRPYLSVPVPAWVEEMVDQRTVESENFKRREVVGNRVGVDTTKQRIACATSAQGLEKSTSREYNVTASYTPEARQWEGWGTALKPALEPITVARKPFRGTVAANVLEHGTGALNIDSCRVGEDPGRWPANLIHDGGPEVEDFLGSAARFFYCPKASKSDRGTDNRHPTVKPTALMRWLVRLVTPPGGLVLDPFAGSGSTGKACKLEGFRFIGCELDPDYAAIARARIAAAEQRQGRLIE